MAKTPKTPSIGPTEPIEGSIPPNPADALRTGQLGTRHFSDQTERRPFSVPVRGMLHRAHGLSNDEFNQPTRNPENGQDCFESVGQDANRYSAGDNPSTTSEGQPIRGT